MCQDQARDENWVVYPIPPSDVVSQGVVFRRWCLIWREFDSPYRQPGVSQLGIWVHLKGTFYPEKGGSHLRYTQKGKTCEYEQNICESK